MDAETASGRRVEGQSEQSPCGRSLQGGLRSWRLRVRGWRPVADGRVLIGLVSSVSELVTVLEAFEKMLDLTWAQKVRVWGGEWSEGMGGASTAGGERNLAGSALFTKLGC